MSPTPSLSPGSQEQDSNSEFYSQPTIFTPSNASVLIVTRQLGRSAQDGTQIWTLPATATSESTASATPSSLIVTRGFEEILQSGSQTRSDPNSSPTSPVSDSSPLPEIAPNAFNVTRKEKEIHSLLSQPHSSSLVPSFPVTHELIPTPSIIHSTSSLVPVDSRTVEMEERDMNRNTNSQSIGPNATAHETKELVWAVWSAKPWSAPYKEVTKTWNSIAEGLQSRGMFFNKDGQYIRRRILTLIEIHHDPLKQWKFFAPEDIKVSLEGALERISHEWETSDENKRNKTTSKRKAENDKDGKGEILKRAALSSLVRTATLSVPTNNTCHNTIIPIIGKEKRRTRGIGNGPKLPRIIQKSASIPTTSESVEIRALKNEIHDIKEGMGKMSNDLKESMACISESLKEMIEIRRKET